MRYLLTGGGTGGHVYPALAIADEIRRHQPDSQFLYVGMKGKLESWVVPGRGYPIRFVRARPFPRSMGMGALLLFCVALCVGVVRSMGILLRFRPQLIIGTGGYVSAPILFAHAILNKVWLSRARIFLYEPNAYPGKLNKVAGRLAHRVGVAFEQAGSFFDMKRVAIVGYPVRREILEVDREAARRELGIADDKKVLFVVGGSGGARAINEAVLEMLPLLRQRSDLLIIHVTGRYKDTDYDAVKETEEGLQRLGITGDTEDWYRRCDYGFDIQNMYGAADLVICRGGAATLTELGVCGLPALIVPLPSSAEDHQAINARELERLGAARVVYQQAGWRDGRVVSRIDGQRLAQRVLELCADDRMRQRMADAARAVPLKNSLELILCEVESLAEGRRPPPLNLEFPLQAEGLPADPNQLLRQVRRRIQEVGGVERLCPRELAYLRYQADRLLVSEGWYEIPLGRRNVGIKLVGSLQYEEQLPLLLGILGDRHSVGGWKRLCGGDFRHGGLLRRNVIEQGLGPLGRTDPEVEAALLEALGEDPYFEVRAAAAQVLGGLFEGSEEIEAALLRRLKDRAPAVVMQAIRALGNIGLHADIVAHLRPFYLHGNWQYRKEVVEALIRLVERGIVAGGEIGGELDQILATSPFFEPEFPLNEKLRALAAMIGERAGRERPKGGESQ